MRNFIQLHLKQLLLFPLLLFGSSIVVAQNMAHPDSSKSIVFIKEIPLVGKKIETDKMGNWYLISSSNQLYKYSTDAKLLSTLNYNYQGNIDQLDVSNPLEIYLFYKELNKIVFLDNNLSFRGEMSLSDMGVSQASSIARTYDNGIWVFDVSDLQLKKLDKDGKLLQTSGNIKQYALKEPVVPIQIIDNGTNVFVNDPVNGVLVFDLFGTFIKTLPITNCTKIKVVDNTVYYFTNNQLFSYQMGLVSNSSYTIPNAPTPLQFDISRNRLFILNGTSIRIYTF